MVSAETARNRHSLTGRRRNVQVQRFDSCPRNCDGRRTGRRRGRNEDALLASATARAPRRAGDRALGGGGAHGFRGRAGCAGVRLGQPRQGQSEHHRRCQGRYRVRLLPEFPVGPDAADYERDGRAFRVRRPGNLAQVAGFRSGEVPRGKAA